MTSREPGPPWPDPIVDVRAASFAYGGAPALDAVSLEARAGEFVGLLGPNGAGKSTLVRLVAGLAAPRAGSVRLAGPRPVPRAAPSRGAGLRPRPAGAARSPGRSRCARR